MLPWIRAHIPQELWLREQWYLLKPVWFRWLRPITPFLYSVQLKTCGILLTEVLESLHTTANWEYLFIRARKQALHSTQAQAELVQKTRKTGYKSLDTEMHCCGLPAPSTETEFTQVSLHSCSSQSLNIS